MQVTCAHTCDTFRKRELYFQFVILRQNLMLSINVIKNKYMQTERCGEIWRTEYTPIPVLVEVLAQSFVKELQHWIDENRMNERISELELSSF